MVASASVAVAGGLKDEEAEILIIGIKQNLKLFLENRINDDALLKEMKSRYI
jgi:hypothetical protein